LGHEKGTQLFSVPLRNSLPPAGIEEASQLPTKATVAALPGTLPGTIDVPGDVHELLRLLAGLSQEERLALIEKARSAKRPTRSRRS